MGRTLLLRTRAEILAEHGDVGSAYQTLEQALSESDALPAGQRSARAVAVLRAFADSLSPFV